MQKEYKCIIKLPRVGSQCYCVAGHWTVVAADYHNLKADKPSCAKWMSMVCSTARWQRLACMYICIHSKHYACMYHVCMFRSGRLKLKLIHSHSTHMKCIIYHMTHHLCMDATTNSRACSVSLVILISVVAY